MWFRLASLFSKSHLCRIYRGFCFATRRMTREQHEQGVTFEEALHEAGSFGLYQKRLVCLICLTSALVLMHNMSPVFTMKIPKHRCQIPGYPNDTYDIQSEIHAQLIGQAIPINSKGDYSKCTVYDADDNTNTSSYNRSTRACSEWVYDRSEFSSTFVTQLNLVCDNQIYRSHSTMAISAGKFFGALITSALGDYFGRRRVYSVIMIILAASAIGLVFPSSLVILIVFRFLIGATTTGAYVCCFVIGTEVVGPKERRWFSTANSVAGTLGTLVSVLIAYLARNGQYFQAVLVVPSIPVIIGYFFIPESPRWLMSKGRHEEAQKIIDVIARANGKSAPPKILTIDKSDLQDGKKMAANPAALFRIPRLFVRYILLYLSWIFVIMCMYGLKFNVSNMDGSVFLNSTIMCLFDFVSIAVFTGLVDRLGRRCLLTAASGVGGLACLSTVLPVALGGNSWILRSLSFFGRLCMTCALNTLYIMSPELFPTVLRSFGLGSSSMMARLGSLASPYVADLNILISGEWGPALPQIVFGVTGVLTAVMTLVQPETKGRSLPETVKDAAEFGRVQNKIQKRCPVEASQDQEL